MFGQVRPPMTWFPVFSPTTLKVGGFGLSTYWTADSGLLNELCKASLACKIIAEKQRTPYGDTDR
jgi:hypothetical protein